MTPRKPKPDPGEQFADIWTQQVVAHRHLRIATYAMGAVLFLLLLVVFRLSNVQAPKPIVIRVDDVGRAEALAYEAVEATADPADPTTKYFLHQFLTDYYGRHPATTQTAWPRALRFLEPALSRQAFDTYSDSIAATALGSARERRRVEGVILRVLPSPEPPYEATADFDLVISDLGTEISRARWTASLQFTFLPTVPPDLLPVNPLGLLVTYLEADQAAAF